MGLCQELSTVCTNISVLQWGSGVGTLGAGVANLTLQVSLLRNVLQAGGQREAEALTGPCMEPWHRLCPLGSIHRVKAEEGLK